MQGVEMAVSNNISQEDLDLKELILALIKKWYVILIFTVIGAGSVFVYGLFHKYVPIYSATAVIQMSDPNLTEFVLKEDNKALVAEKLGIDQKDVIMAGFTQQSGDKSLFNLTIQSVDRNKAKEQVNAWADVAIEQVQNSILGGAQSAIDKAQASVESADLILVQFLIKNNLSSLTWTELENLTGVISDSNFLAIENPIDETQEPIMLSETQRLKLAELMRQKVTTEQAYQDISNSNNKILSDYRDQNYFVVSKAEWTSEITNNPKSIKGIVIGGVLGFLTSIICLSFLFWWNNHL